MSNQESSQSQATAQSASWSDSEDEGNLALQLEALEEMKANLKAKLAAKAKEKAAAKVQVPSTPPRRGTRDEAGSRTPEQKTPTSASKAQWSPSRVLLGVDKGTKASEVSLKRPPKQPRRESPSPSKTKTPARPLSFAERLDQARLHEAEAADRKQNIDRLRRHKFGLTSNLGTSDTTEKPAAVKSDNGVSVESHTRLRLSKRFLSEEALKEELKDVHPMNIPNVYAEVTFPDYREPQYPNYVVFGIVSRKGEVKQSRVGKKYVMLTLTDLQYEIPLAIHGDALEKFWKIRPGTMIAVLNPGIYTVKSHGESTALGLKITDSVDVVLELGIAHDLGTCAAITSKGHQCTNWVDARRNTYCEFHAELGLKRARAQRQEVNAAPTKMHSPRRNGKRMAVYTGGSVTQKQGLLPDPFAPQYHEGARIYSSGGGPVGDDYDELTPEMQASRLAKRSKTIEREQEIRRMLAKLPGGQLLREYDSKGQLVSSTAADQPATSGGPPSPGRLFTPQHVRRIGFDPTRRREMAKDREMPRLSAAQVSLSKPPPASSTAADSSDDDLDII